MTLGFGVLAVWNIMNVSFLLLLALFLKPDTQNEKFKFNWLFLIQDSALFIYF